MAELIKAPKGTKDIVPSEVYKWHYVEGVLRTIAMQYGFEEIRFPNFEHTELFNRGIGDTTDVVQKEMYTFNDKGGRSVTLRPEGTASTVRAYLENSLYAKGLPFKGYYIVPNYRYENVQKGRLREHHQFGVEVFGAPTPATDAEIISLADTALKRLGITEVVAHINSIGCPECRPKYYAALKEYLEKQGVPFASETDTEVVAQLIEYFYETDHVDILEAVGRVLRRIEGAYALGIICADCPDRLIAVRKDSPLILGVGEGENFLASDVTAIIKHTREVIYMEDGEVAVLTRDGILGWNIRRTPFQRRAGLVTLFATSAGGTGAASGAADSASSVKQLTSKALRVMYSPLLCNF